MRYTQINTLLFGAIAFLILLLFSSCSDAGSDSPLPEESGVPVTFSGADVTSRAETTSAGFSAEGSAFKVFGVYFDPTKSGFFNLFDGTVVTRTADAWTYQPERYWLAGFTYDFRAIYPAVLSDEAELTFDKGEGADSHLILSNFTADGTDLMVASERRVILQGEETPRAAVALKFRHILSRVTFTAKTDDRYLGSDGKPVRKLYIVGFKINNIAIKGNWVGDSYNTDGSSLGEWSPGEPTGSYTANIPAGGIAIGNTPVKLFDGEDIVIAIPQPFESAMVEIQYKYSDEDTVVHTAVAELSGAWLPGKSYSYSFKINAHIFFDTPKVDDWVSAPINSSDLDIQLPL